MDVVWKEGREDIEDTDYFGVRRSREHELIVNHTKLSTAVRSPEGNQLIV
jgi:hypothetical protein